MTYAITGASGQLGRLTAELLLRHTSPSDVALVTRDPARLGDFVARGVDVRAGDFDDPASLEGAFAGVDRLLLVSTDVVGVRIPQHEAAVAASVAAGVQRVIYTSMINPSDSNPAFVAHEHRATEYALQQSGLAWTMLRNGIYIEMLLEPARGAIASGTLVTNTGDGVNVHVAREDCAAVAATVLVEDGHEGRSYDVTGAEPLDARGQAALYAELSGSPVGVTDVDDAGWAEAMSAHGVPREQATVYATFGASQRAGYAAVRSSAVQDITGRPPRSLREVLAPALRSGA